MKKDQKAWHPKQGSQAFLFKLEPLKPGTLESCYDAICSNAGLWVGRTERK